MSLVLPTARPSLDRRSSEGSNGNTAARKEQHHGRRRTAPMDPWDTFAENGSPLSDRTVNFARVFDAVPSPCLLLTPQFVICGANQAYLRATHRTVEELYGQFMFDAFPDNPDDPTANGVANLRTSLERALRTRRPDTMAVQKYDIEVRAGHGARFEERFWSPVNVPVLDAQGRVELLIHRVDDVTALIRHRAGQSIGQVVQHPPFANERQAEHLDHSQPTGADTVLLQPEGPTDHEIAIALQRALLPHAVQSVGSLQVSTRYLPARTGLDVCGDWYDVAELNQGTMGVVLGDVVGHGLNAAAVMGQLRGIAAAALHVGARPSAAMDVLERRARCVDGAMGATAFLAVIDETTRTLTYCNADQVPPLLVRPDQTIVELDEARSPVLCVFDEDITHHEATVAFGPGSLLVAFTDGLVERPGEHMSYGYDRLRRAMGSPPTDLERWTDAIVAAALDSYVHTDDIATVTVYFRHR